MQPETKVEAGQYAAVDNSLQRMSVYAAQMATYPLFLALRIIFVRNKLYRETKNLNLKQHGAGATYLLYANHQSKLDPFIICASLPFRTIRHLLPFRFFVENSYFKRGPAKVFLNVMGGFPAHYEANRPYGLDKARALMATNQTVVIFPPGMRTRERIAKPGVSILATEPNVHLIPVHVDWQHRWHCQVRIGAPIQGGVTHPPEHLMERVYGLQAQRNR